MLLNFDETKLSNGIRVATTNMPGIESVAMGVWVGVGGRYEDKRISGVSHFIEHLLFKGTKTRSAKDISQAIEGRGGYFNAFTQEESTCYYARISAEHMKSTFAILADMYLNPKFSAADINKERGVIIEEIMMYKDQPQHLVQEILGELLWQDHALGRPLIGTTDTVGKVSRADILNFKNTKYVADNTMVVFAGKVDHNECVKLVKNQLGRVHKARRPGYTDVTKQTKQKDVHVFAKDIEQTHVALGIRLFGRHDSRRYPLKLLSIILGENMSSRLFQVVREKHGLAYSIHSSVQLFDETGVLDIQAGVDCDQLSRAIALILSELAKTKDKPMGSQELRRAKDYAIGQLRIGLESTSNQMMWIGENLMSYDRFIQPSEVIRKVEAVSEKDIHRVAGEVLNSKNLSVAMITPGGNEKHTDLIREKMAVLD